MKTIRKVLLGALTLLAGMAGVFAAFTFPRYVREMRLVRARLAAGSSVSDVKYPLYGFFRTAVPLSSARIARCSLRKSAAFSAGISTWRTMYSRS